MGELSAYVLTFARFVTGFVFVWSAGSKLRDIAAFERAVKGFEILPNELVKPAARLFICSELVVVVTMILEPFLRAGFGLAALLLLMFSVALSTVLVRNLQTPCNCFGTTSKPASRGDLLRNAGLLGCALAGMLFPSTPSLGIMENALVGLMAMTVSVVWIKLGDAAEIFL